MFRVSRFDAFVGHVSRGESAEKDGDAVLLRLTFCKERERDEKGSACYCICINSTPKYTTTTTTTTEAYVCARCYNLFAHHCVLLQCCDDDARALRLRLDFYIVFLFSRAILFILINSRAAVGLHPHHHQHRPDLPSIKMGCYYYYRRCRRRE